MSQRIYIADSDTATIKQLTSELSAKGYNVLSEEDGNRALKMVNVNTVPHLIISGTRLEELDALSFCKELKRESRTRDIPILMLRPNEFNEEPFKAIRVNEFLTKPLNMTDLHHKIELMLKYGRSSNLPAKSQQSKMTGIIISIIIGIFIILVLLMVVGIDNLMFWK